MILNILMMIPLIGLILWAFVEYFKAHRRTIIKVLIEVGLVLILWGSIILFAIGLGRLVNG